MPPNSTPTRQRRSQPSPSLAENLWSREGAQTDREHGDGLPKGPIYKTALETAEFVVSRKLGRRGSKNKYGEKMSMLTSDMLRKHELALSRMGERLQLSPSNIEETFRSVANDTFQDGVNFGRIVSLFTFCVVVSEYCVEHDMDDKVKNITRLTADTLYDHRKWFESHGGWVSDYLKMCKINIISRNSNSYILFYLISSKQKFTK